LKFFICSKFREKN